MPSLIFRVVYAQVVFLGRMNFDTLDSCVKIWPICSISIFVESLMLQLSDCNLVLCYSIPMALEMSEVSNAYMVILLVLIGTNHSMESITLRSICLMDLTLPLDKSDAHIDSEKVCKALGWGSKRHEPWLMMVGKSLVSWLFTT